MPEYVYRVVGLALFVVYRVVRRVWEARLRAHLKEKPTIERAPVRERVLLGCTDSEMCRHIVSATSTS
jgi:hypothetical protein